MPAASSRPREPATWELVLKRNPVERLKQEKAPLGIRDELPALIAMGYESVPEEDVVRLQWWGLYHDKPKVGTFMLRLKIPNGILPPAKLRAIGEVSNRYGRGDAELSTRQCIQLHWRRLGGFGPDDHGIEIRSAITNVWSEDLRYRVSRVKARLKFMVDDIGAEGMRERVEARLGRTLESLTLPSIDARPSNHIGVHAQK